jgi:hypothetical protein
VTTMTSFAASKQPSSRTTLRHACIFCRMPTCR